MNKLAVIGGVAFLVLAVAFINSNRPATLQLITRPDAKKPGHLGIGVYVKRGSRYIATAQDGTRLRAEVEIRDQRGEVVHRADEEVTKFSMG